MFPLFKLVLVFALLVFLLRLRVHIGFSFVAATLSAGILFSMQPLDVLAACSSAALRQDTLELVAVVILAMMLSNFWESTGELSRLVGLIRQVFRKPKLALIAPASLIGFLPMPGGALFSAPMVRGLSDPLSVSPENQTLVNYWFRHVWEYVWPMYPGIVFVAQLSGLSLDSIILLQLPLAASAILSGTFLILRGVGTPSSPSRPDSPAAPASVGGNPSQPGKDAGAEESVRKELRPCLTKSNLVFSFLVRISPLVLTFGVFLLAGRGLGLPFPLPMGLVGGIVLAVALVYEVRERPAARESSPQVPHLSLGLFLSKQVPLIALMALSVKMFADVLQRSGAVDEVQRSLSTSGLPVVAIIVALPFIVGLLVGLTMGYIGATFPLLLSFPYVQDRLAPSMVLAFAAGFAGVMVSPMHLCLVLSNEYFRSRQSVVMRRLIPLAGTILAVGIALFFLYSAIPEPRLTR